MVMFEDLHINTSILYSRVARSIFGDNDKGDIHGEE